MFTNKDIRHYSCILQYLNQEKDIIPEGYEMFLKDGGKDGIPHFNLLFHIETQTYVIWVRGTDFIDVNDVFINLRTKPIEFYKGCCHNGYFIAANEIIAKIIDFFNRDYVNEIICLGHSLGGAVASVIATILNKFEFESGNHINRLRENNKIRALIYGTPPTFSRDICYQTHNFISNIVLKKDVVPKLGGMFNSLLHLQRQNVTQSLKNIGGLNKKNNVNVNRSDNDLKADYLPGKVFIIDESDNKFVVKLGDNHSVMMKYSDICGIAHHQYEKYYNAIQKFVPDDENLFDKSCNELNVPKLNEAYVSIKRDVPEYHHSDSYYHYTKSMILQDSQIVREKRYCKNSDGHFIFKNEINSNV